MAPSEQRTRARGSRDLRTLKWAGVILPVLFVVILEVFRFGFVETSLENQAGHILVTAITITAVVGFALLMFSFIERAQQQVIRQNRELAAVNAVSTAVQGELGVDHIIDAALRSVINSTGATEASVTVFAPEGGPGGDAGIERRLVVEEHATGWGEAGSSVPHLVDIPLATGTTVVGRMRLHLPGDVAEPDLLASATLQNIGHQLACAVHVGALVADLQRRRREGHGLLDVLLQISNQGPLADILAAVVRHARDLLESDEAVLCLNASAAGTVRLDAPSSGMVPLGDGTFCISPESGRFANLHAGQTACPLRQSPDLAWSLEVPLRNPDGVLGDIWIGRKARVPYTDRDRGYLVTLADLASIAITSARMRENERQGAMLAERDRIAREMHDSLAQVLGVVHLRLRALGPHAQSAGDLAMSSQLNDLAGLAEEAYRDVREAILGLRESSRSDRGFFEGLRAYLDKYGHQAGIKATLEVATDQQPLLAPRAEVQVIRVIQEALTNTRKHAGASTAVVRVTNSDDWTTFTIEDDGRGFDPTGTLLGHDGFGLHTMRERMDLIGGTLLIDSAPGRGTRVVARVPGVPNISSLPAEVAGASNGARPDPARR